MKRKCKHCKSTHIYVSDIGKDEYEFVCMGCYTYYDEKFKIKKTINSGKRAIVKSIINHTDKFEKLISKGNQ